MAGKDRCVACRLSSFLLALIQCAGDGGIAKGVPANLIHFLLLAGTAASIQIFLRGGCRLVTVCGSEAAFNN